MTENTETEYPAGSSVYQTWATIPRDYRLPAIPGGRGRMVLTMDTAGATCLAPWVGPKGRPAAEGSA